jgi:phosphinothricin acetyltransferase
MLLGALVDRAAAAGKHAMIAGIDADNAVSLRLHSAFGVVEMGRLAEVGRKFGRWLDLVFMQRLLPEADKAADGGLHA